MFYLFAHKLYPTVFRQSWISDKEEKSYIVEDNPWDIPDTFSFKIDW
ncbi:hypothetical protein BROOK1789C_2105 [Bathymodiolus brooksi thiotrophic gill symbiont]|nr:hypothetical protein BROOK1789C_2105 [Bathymodiolus brooksi thiotrophic gill symbiont]